MYYVNPMYQQQVKPGSEDRMWPPPRFYSNVIHDYCTVDDSELHGSYMDRTKQAYFLINLFCFNDWNTQKS